jgi:hypothetical protein
MSLLRKASRPCYSIMLMGRAGSTKTMTEETIRTFSGISNKVVCITNSDKMLKSYLADPLHLSVIDQHCIQAPNDDYLQIWYPR